MNLPLFIRTIVFRKEYLIIFVTMVLVFLLTCQYHISRLHQKHIATLAWTLTDKLIVIDPGHGGDDPGALGLAGTREKDIVLEVSKKLGEFFSQAGATVLLTRDKDIDLSGSSPGGSYGSVVRDLNNRVEMANDKGADLFIGVHVNSFPDRSEGGGQTFSQPGSVESRKLAVAIQEELNRFLANPGRQAKEVDYFTSRNTKMPCVIVEIGFISNPREEKLMADPLYQSKIAWSIYAGTVRYLSQSKPVITPVK